VTQKAVSLEEWRFSLALAHTVFDASQSQGATLSTQGHRDLSIVVLIPSDRMRAADGGCERGTILEPIFSPDTVRRGVPDHSTSQSA
jgi:hypothetical protein